MSYSDYVEQFTYLLFLKMADERSRPPYNQPSPVLPGYDWESLRWPDGIGFSTVFAPPATLGMASPYVFKLHMLETRMPSFMILTVPTVRT